MHTIIDIKYTGIYLFSVFSLFSSDPEILITR